MHVTSALRSVADRNMIIVTHERLCIYIIHVSYGSVYNGNVSVRGSLQSSARICNFGTLITALTYNLGLKIVTRQKAIIYLMS